MTSRKEVNDLHVVLASRSPRRRELLGLLIPPDCIAVLPPRDSTEAGFDDLHDIGLIERRLQEIARAKCKDVTAQIANRSHQLPYDRVDAVIAADTTIVATDAAGRPVVLGQPPEGEAWGDVVRQWFREYYAGRTHLALTGLCVTAGDGRSWERVVRTEVTFRPDIDRFLDWYLASGEPRGKAGGYGLQGAGSLFVTRVEGSLSNVIGLPLEALFEILEERR